MSKTITKPEVGKPFTFIHSGGIDEKLEQNRR